MAPGSAHNKHHGGYKHHHGMNHGGAPGDVARRVQQIEGRNRRTPAAPSVPAGPPVVVLFVL